jgi:hypothetical protein
MSSRRFVFVIIPLLVALPALGETIYKQRSADGRTTYSNSPLPGGNLVQAPPSAPAAPVGQPAAPERAAQSARYEEQAEARIRARVVAREIAWNEVRSAEADLAEAQRRLSAASQLQEGDLQALGGPAQPAPAPVGGPQAGAPVAVGGAQPAAPPAVGGPLGTRRGGGRTPEYYERIAMLERAVDGAQRRLERARRSYNDLP